MNKFYEKYLETLTESVCEIVKKISTGIPISSAELMCFKCYQREIRNVERVPLQVKLTRGLGTLQKFLSNALSDITTSEEEVNNDVQ